MICMKQMDKLFAPILSISSECHEVPAISINYYVLVYQVHAVTPCQVLHHELVKFHALWAPTYHWLEGIPIQVEKSQEV